MNKFVPFIDQYGFVINYETGHQGDACWQSSWLFSSYLILFGKKSKHYEAIKKEYDSKMEQRVDKFLAHFADSCLLKDRLLVHPEHTSQMFSRDQLAPLLLLLVCVWKYRPLLIFLGKEIIQHIVALDDRYGHLSPDPRGKIRDNLRYIIAEVADLYEVPYKRSKGANFYELTLIGYEKIYQWNKLCDKNKKKWFVPKKLKTKIPEPAVYAIFNNTAIVTALSLMHNKHHFFGHYFRWYAENWPKSVHYKIVARKSYNENEIKWFKNKKHNTVDILSERGWQIPNQNFKGKLEYLDIPVLRSMQSIWG